MNGEPFSIADAAAFIAAIDAELEATTRTNVEAVRKGRLTAQEADYVTALIRDIRSDLVHAFGPLEIGQSFERPDAAVSWHNKNRWIGRELEDRTEQYPELVAKGRLTRQEAAIGIRVMTTLRRLYWKELFMWDPEPGPALDFVRACRRYPPTGFGDSIEKIHGAGRTLYRELVRKHLAAVELEDGAQGRLVA